MAVEKTWGSILIRWTFFLGTIYLGWYLYHRYERVTLSLHEDGMKDLYPPESMVLVDLKAEKIWGGDVVVYRLPGESDFHIARVHAVAGDLVELGPKGVSVNGATIYREKLTDDPATRSVLNPVRVPEGGKASFRVRIGEVRLPQSVLDSKRIPEGTVILLNDNVDSLKKDSQTLGVIPVEWIFGTVARAWPW